MLRYAKAPRPQLFPCHQNKDQVAVGLSLRLDEKRRSRQGARAVTASALDQIARLRRERKRNAHAAAALVARMEDAALDRAPVWDDLATFDGRGWRGKVDCVAAGYPCQPFSSTGRRLGAADPRHLWPHVACIVRETAARVVFPENVEGHLALGFREVARELQGLGYRVEAGLFSAYEVGAPHWRRRLFALAYADGGREGLPAGDRHEPEPPLPVPPGETGQYGLREAARQWTQFVNLARALGLAPGRFPSTASSPRVLASLEPGGGSWTEDLTFNPSFAEWMLGWPTGWTDPARPVTGWSRWRQRSLSALSMLGTDKGVEAEGAS